MWLWLSVIILTLLNNTLADKLTNHLQEHTFLKDEKLFMVSNMFWGYLAPQFTYTLFHTKTYILINYQCDF